MIKYKIINLPDAILNFTYILFYVIRPVDLVQIIKHIIIASTVFSGNMEYLTAAILILSDYVKMSCQYTFWPAVPTKTTRAH